jgi:hypothetical protein
LLGAIRIRGATRGVPRQRLGDKRYECASANAGMKVLSRSFQIEL